MSYLNSNLTNPYRCDFVFAVTQGAINAAMMNYLSDSPFPEISCVWVMSEGSHPAPVQIPYKKLMELAHNTDPFKVPDGIDPDKNQDVKNLVGARFLGGFRAQIGLPSGLDESVNVVTLGADTASVQFNLLCSSFHVVQYTPASQFTDPSWMNKSQPADKPWIFQSRVNLKLAKFEGSDSTLPAAVQDRIKSLQLQPGTFSIQQLFLHLDDPGGATVPSIIGVPIPSMLHDWLQEYFLGAYWTTMIATKQPVLAHAITGQADQSSLALTSLNFQTSPFIPSGQPPKNPGDLDTLCYLGETNNNVLPVTTGAFPWNWIDETERSQWHGAVAINQASLKVWLTKALLPYVKTQCMRFSPQCSAKGSYIYLQCTPYSGVDPTTSTPGPNQLAYFTYTVKEDSSARSSEITGQENFSLEVVQSSETQIKIVQKILVQLYVYVFGSHTNGNVINSEITSIYDISVDAEGSVHFTLNAPLSTRKDNPDSLDFRAFADWLLDSPNEKVIDPVTNTIRSLADSLGNPNLSTARFIVPGHAAVAYSGAKFSQSGDMVFHLTYGTPAL
ncbi:MAG: hypothetical protein JO182_13720 [Acidobacteriaceae bacterium]|nr:hypothetical protein [Acidobacteriaceae bacterium]